MSKERDGEREEDGSVGQNEPSEDEPNCSHATASLSPRGKKARHESSGDSPFGIAAGRPQASRDLLVAASPPRFINMEDIMKLANGVTDMALAHEIAVGENFRLEPAKPNPNSLEGRIRDVMQKAFWDVLAESLREDPPDYTHALVLLRELKQSLCDLLLPQHARLRASIDEVLDLELIEQQAEHGCLNFRGYADFVIDKMAMLCAPVRDEQIAGLRNRTEIVPLFRDIMSILDLMRLDMVNFTISQVRPLVQQHSVEYERKKFQALLEVQRGNGVDGLEFTRQWLSRHVCKLPQDVTSPPPSTSSASAVAASESGGKTSAPCPTPDVAASSAGTTAASTGSSAAETTCSTATLRAVLDSAFMETLDWNDELHIFPETLLIDQQRFIELRDKANWLTLIASVVIVTYNSVGASIAGLSELKTKLASHVGLITKDVSRSEMPQAMINVAEQVIKEVNDSLVQRGYAALKVEQQLLIQGQIVAIIEPNNSIYQLLKNRLLSFYRQIIQNPRVRDIQLPSGFSAVADEVASVIGQFLRLTGYNRAVFSTFYSDIVSDCLKSRE